MGLPRSSRSGSRSSLLAVAVAVGLTWVACSTPAGDGESCEQGSDCASGGCVNGACAGSDCTCEGADCRGRSSCREGWLCTRGEAVTDKALPQCRLQCTGVGTCPSDKRCENGVCREGGEPFALSWSNIPRAVPCGPRVPCTYKVTSSSSVTIDRYTWSFGDAPAVETKDPSTEFTYTSAGSYSVLVRARSTAGGLAELRTTEILCVGGLDDPCDVNTSLCCEGTCVRGICK